VIQFHVSTAIRIAVSTHVAEILRGVGPKVSSDIMKVESSPDFMITQGLHAREIAKPMGLHPTKLGMYRNRIQSIPTHVSSARALRLLATKLHIR
jgi:hypothetical protein